MENNDPNLDDDFYFYEEPPEPTWQNWFTGLASVAGAFLGMGIGAITCSMALSTAIGGLQNAALTATSVHAGLSILLRGFVVLLVLIVLLQLVRLYRAATAAALGMVLIVLIAGLLFYLKPAS
jgi:hypothetical protein